MGGKMAKRNFTEEERQHLLASSYVLDVSPTIVHFLAEFKKRFWEALLDGKKPRAIVLELGLNPDVLAVTESAVLKR
jgi:hypothetical protein